jgi:hypothetical protein
VSELLFLTGSLAIRHGVDEPHETRATEELGQEHSGMPLRVGVLNPLQTWPKDARLAAALAQHATSVAAHDLNRTPPQNTQNSNTPL